MGFATLILVVGAVGLETLLLLQYRQWDQRVQAAQAQVVQFANAAQTAWAKVADRGRALTALETHLPPSVDALAVWRRYNGRADFENRIKELGAQFGIRRLCVQNFWGTEALHQLAIAA